MSFARQFGRRQPTVPVVRTVGAPATSPPAPSCTYKGYLTDQGAASTNGVQDGVVGLALVGAGWLLGGVIPVVGRTLGVAAGAALAGGTSYARFASWKSAGGSSHTKGACDTPPSSP